VRSPTDLGRRPFVHPRRRVAILIGIVVLLIALFSLRSLAFLWTDQLWFSSLGFSNVFSTLLEVKIGLALTFGVFFFLLLFGNLLLADRFGARDLSFDADDELVRRFQELVRPYARRTYAVISLIAGFIAGLTAIGQWNNYILYANAQSFHQTDPIFHKDIGFYVFKLPFLTFIVDWLLASLIAVIVLTAFFHYLNGGIRASRSSPHVSSVVKAHLSVLLAAVAVMKALGYVIAKWQLVVSNNGYVEGAGYADIHARIPALTILFVLSLAAAVILLVNIRTRSWSLPLIAIGLWLVVAIAIGYIYPAALQALKVTPAQRTLEATYIQRNIDATLQGFGLNNVHVTTFAASSKIPPADLNSSAATLANIRLWDPDPSIALQTTQRLEDIQQYYDFTSLAVDRYSINGKVTPVLIGTRQINPNGLAAPSWVNEHLVYTHGIGGVIIPANTVQSSTGNPVFALGNVPPTTSDKLPTLTQPDVYFGIDQPGWVVAGTNQAELNYKTKLGTQVTNHYGVTGGDAGSVAAGGFFRRLAFAVRFGDFNMLISNQITPQSRVIFVRDVQQMAEKAAPFISWANDAYPVIYDGEIDYVIDGFTTTSEYPYSENADNQNVANSGGLPASYNYIRNSVKLVINAYTGKMTFYAWDQSPQPDPILAAYRAAFPGMFQPESSMPPSIMDHMRYPSALLAIQAATLGRYHITKASAFYTASDQWSLSPTVGAGSPSQTLKRTNVLTSSGQIESSSLTPMSPIYEVMALPGSTTQQLVLLTAFQPAGGDVVQGITAFMTATSNPNDYGALDVFETPRGQNVVSPAQADAYMNQNAAASAQFTLLDKDGSSVILGNSLLMPIGESILYVRPMYVTSTATSSPQLRDVLVDFGNKVGFAPTLSGALAQIFGTATTTAPRGQSASNYLAAADIAYADAQAALHDGNLALYQKDVGAMNRDIQLAQSALSKK
jgi:uncharacterized protein